MASQTASVRPDANAQQNLDALKAGNKNGHPIPVIIVQEAKDDSRDSSPANHQQHPATKDQSQTQHKQSNSSQSVNPQGNSAPQASEKKDGKAGEATQKQQQSQPLPQQQQNQPSQQQQQNQPVIQQNQQQHPQSSAQQQQAYPQQYQASSQQQQNQPLVQQNQQQNPQSSQQQQHQNQSSSQQKQNPAPVQQPQNQSLPQQQQNQSLPQQNQSSSQQQQNQNQSQSLPQQQQQQQKQEPQNQAVAQQQKQNQPAVQQQQNQNQPPVQQQQSQNQPSVQSSAQTQSQQQTQNQNQSSQQQKQEQQNQSVAQQQKQNPLPVQQQQQTQSQPQSQSLPQQQQQNQSVSQQNQSSSQQHQQLPQQQQQQKQEPQSQPATQQQKQNQPPAQQQQQTQSLAQSQPQNQSSQQQNQQLPQQQQQNQSQSLPQQQQQQKQESQNQPATQQQKQNQPPAQQQQNQNQPTLQQQQSSAQPQSQPQNQNQSLQQQQQKNEQNQSSSQQQQQKQEQQNQPSAQQQKQSQVSGQQQQNQPSVQQQQSSAQSQQQNQQQQSQQLPQQQKQEQQNQPASQQQKQNQPPVQQQQQQQNQNDTKQRVDQPVSNIEVKPQDKGPVANVQQKDQLAYVENRPKDQNVMNQSSIPNKDNRNFDKPMSDNTQASMYRDSNMIIENKPKEQVYSGQYEVREKQKVEIPNTMKEGRLVEDSHVNRKEMLIDGKMGDRSYVPNPSDKSLSDPKGSKRDVRAKEEYYPVITSDLFGNQEDNRRSHSAIAKPNPPIEDGRYKKILNDRYEQQNENPIGKRGVSPILRIRRKNDVEEHIRQHKIQELRKWKKTLEDKLDSLNEQLLLLEKDELLDIYNDSPRKVSFDKYKRERKDEIAEKKKKALEFTKKMQEQKKEIDMQKQKRRDLNEILLMKELDMLNQRQLHELEMLRGGGGKTKLESDLEKIRDKHRPGEQVSALEERKKELKEKRDFSADNANRSRIDQDAYDFDRRGKKSGKYKSPVLNQVLKWDEEQKSVEYEKLRKRRELFEKQKEYGREVKASFLPRIRATKAFEPERRMIFGNIPGQGFEGHMQGYLERMYAKRVEPTHRYHHEHANDSFSKEPVDQEMNIHTNYSKGVASPDKRYVREGQADQRHDDESSENYSRSVSYKSATGRDPRNKSVQPDGRRKRTFDGKGEYSRITEKKNHNISFNPRGYEEENIDLKHDLQKDQLVLKEKISTMLGDIKKMEQQIKQKEELLMRDMERNKDHRDLP